MSTATERIEVFQDTLRWIKSEPEFSASIPVAKKKTMVFSEDDYPCFDTSKTKNMVVTVTGDRSY